MTSIQSGLEISAGTLIWLGALWDGFATIILPRTVAPMRRYSGRFYKRTWWLWSGIGRRIRQPDLRLSFLSIYGPISVMALIIIWAGLMIGAFALIYHGLGPRFQADRGPMGFGALLYMSGSTFLTLGIGDITSADPLARFVMILETATGYMFLGLMITYMPLLHQAYAAREVGNLLIHARAGNPSSGITFLHSSCGAGGPEVLRTNLQEAERWMAEILQSHLSHPVLSFYRAQHWGQSWLVSLATILDCCTVLIVGGDGPAAAQARITHRMGIRLLEDLTHALHLRVDPRCPTRLTAVDLTSLRSALTSLGVDLHATPSTGNRLLELSGQYDRYLLTLGKELVIPIPSWIVMTEQARAADNLNVP